MKRPFAIERRWVGTDYEPKSYTTGAFAEDYGRYYEWHLFDEGSAGQYEYADAAKRDAQLARFCACRRKHRLGWAVRMVWRAVNLETGEVGPGIGKRVHPQPGPELVCSHVTESSNGQNRWVEFRDGEGLSEDGLTRLVVPEHCVGVVKAGDVWYWEWSDGS